jgi:hypothetical protein
MLTFTGIGNISARIIRPGQKSSLCVSMPGIIGYNFSNSRSFEYKLSNDDFIILASDGLKSAFTVPDLSVSDPSLLAALLYKDFKRGNDDATAVILRYGEA